MNKKKIKVLFAASELAPIAKVGGLADVMEGLPRALHRLGISARIVIPFYAHVRMPCRKKFSFFVGKARAHLWEGKLGGITVYLLENKFYFGRGPIYASRTAFADTDKETKKFLFFSEAVYSLLQDHRFWKPDVVHCNDWHTGELARILKESRQQGSPKIVFTIHNLQNQGRTAKGNPMANGIASADMVNTVSPTYAKEILTTEYSCGLEGELSTRAGERKLKGILNGTDYAYWPKIKRNKKAFQNMLGLSQLASVPVFGFIARLTSQKGVRLILPLVENFAKSRTAQFVFLGQGERDLEQALATFAKRYPRFVYVKIGFDEKLARAIYAQSDFFLMPSVFEPCGLGQMIAMRYGTPPIVRATGGLKDSVKHFRTGLVFKKPRAEELIRVARMAMRLYHTQKFRRMTKMCMQQDFSWRASALAYKKMYQRILSEK